jgi:hypothetical protein
VKSWHQFAFWKTSKKQLQQNCKFLYIYIIFDFFEEIMERRNSIESDTTDSQTGVNIANPEDSEDLFQTSKSESLPKALNPSTSLSPRPETTSPPRSQVPPLAPIVSTSSPTNTDDDLLFQQKKEERHHRRAALFRDASKDQNERQTLRQLHGPAVGKSANSSMKGSPTRIAQVVSVPPPPPAHPPQALIHDHSGCPACTAAAAAAAHHPYYEYYDPYHLPGGHPAAPASPSGHYYPQPPHPRMYGAYAYPVKPDPIMVAQSYADHHYHQHHHFHQHAQVPPQQQQQVAAEAAASASSSAQKIAYHLEDTVNMDSAQGSSELHPPVINIPGIKKDGGKMKSGAAAAAKKQVKIKVDSSSEAQSLSPSKLSPAAVRRKRSAELSELIFEGFLTGDKPGLERFVRKWRNSRNLVFYDCACGRRKAGKFFSSICFQSDIFLWCSS